VIKVHHEHEVVQLLQLAQRHHVPVTFRAAGTSLSGQAITDSILIKVGSRHTHTGGGLWGFWGWKGQETPPCYYSGPQGQACQATSDSILNKVTCRLELRGRSLHRYKLWPHKW
jgi:hypothetical protein